METENDSYMIWTTLTYNVKRTGDPTDEYRSDGWMTFTTVVLVSGMANPTTTSSDSHNDMTFFVLGMGASGIIAVLFYVAVAQYRYKGFGVMPPPPPEGNLRLFYIPSQVSEKQMRRILVVRGRANMELRRILGR